MTDNLTSNTKLTPLENLACDLSYILEAAGWQMSVGAIAAVLEARESHTRNAQPPSDAQWAQALDIIGQCAEIDAMDEHAKSWIAEAERFFDEHAVAILRDAETKISPL